MDLQVEMLDQADLTDPAVLRKILNTLARHIREIKDRLESLERKVWTGGYPPDKG